MTWVLQSRRALVTLEKGVARSAAVLGLGGWLAAGALVLSACGAEPAPVMPPDLAEPDLAMPDLAMPDLAMPDLWMPDLAEPPPPKCSAITCSSGCCAGDSCQAGNSVASCGSGGLACATCPPHQVCLADQKCGLDLDARWLIGVMDAEISTTKPDGSGWDFGSGAPDPYVVFEGIYQTRYIDNTFRPMWGGDGFIFSARQLTQSGIGIRLNDDDIGSDDVIAGQRTFRFTDADLARGQVTIFDWDSVKNITFVLRKQ